MAIDRKQDAMARAIFTFTMDLEGDADNFAHDVSAALARAAEDTAALRGSFATTNGGMIENIQGRVLASWEVTTTATL